MPRAIWSGAISFGLVSIPVKLFPAVSRKSVRFNQLDGRTMQRVKQKRVNTDGEEVPYDEIVKGYEVMKDSYVVITDEELASVSPKASRTIDIIDFVEAADIDPVFYDSGYYLVPDELARKSYALLARAMSDDGRVAIASFIMRTKQYLAAVRPIDGKLMLSTMVYSDELVDSDEIPGLEEVQDLEVSDAEKAMAHQLIDSLAAEFEPSKYRDTHRDDLMAMIQAKSSGELTAIEAPAAAETAGVVDLLAALEKSVEAAKEARKRHPAGADGAEAAAAKPKKAAKKPAKRKSA